jgi:threonine/homoserine efflux transporter RhtA
VTAWAAGFPGAATDRLDWVGAVLGVVAALVYTAYILTGDRLLSGVALLSTVGVPSCCSSPAWPGRALGRLAAHAAGG